MLARCRHLFNEDVGRRRCACSQLGSAQMEATTTPRFGPRTSVRVAFPCKPGSAAAGTFLCLPLPFALVLGGLGQYASIAWPSENRHQSRARRRLSRTRRVATSIWQRCEKEPGHGNTYQFLDRGLARRPAQQRWAMRVKSSRSALAKSDLRPRLWPSWQCPWPSRGAFFGEGQKSNKGEAEPHSRKGNHPRESSTDTHIERRETPTGKPH